MLVFLDCAVPAHGHKAASTGLLNVTGSQLETGARYADCLFLRVPAAAFHLPGGGHLHVLAVGSKREVVHDERIASGPL